MQIIAKIKPCVPINITTPAIKLDSFLKLCNAVSTGGQAKALVLGGQVRVNGELCLQRGKALVSGDKVSVDAGISGGYWQVVKR